MRVLFVTRRFAALRNFEAVVRGLVARGHDVELAALEDDVLGGAAMTARWQAEMPGLRVGRAPRREPGDPAEAVTEKVRLALDYVRYLEPAYRDTPRLVQRATDRTPRAMLWITRAPGAKTAIGRRVLRAWLRGLERALPAVPAVEAYLRDRRADVVVFTPLIGLGSPEVDYLRSAQALGLRTIFAVWSWDNLSTKALIRWVPDVITVWNETQRQEAVQLHGVPASRVVVTGAQCFDHWFDRVPSRSREAFCAQVGLPADPPFVLYVCSALFHGSPAEAPFVVDWLKALRTSRHPRLAAVPVLVRPHPSRLGEWGSVSLEGLGPVVLRGRNPVDADARADYFDSLSYASVVVGLNTSAFLEAAIVGRPVLAPLPPQFRENQEGTLHFPYLLRVAGGLLHTATTLEAHVDQLATAIADPERYAARSTRFVEAFLRPNGLAEAGTPRVIATIESVGARPAGAARPEAVTPLAQWTLACLTRGYCRPFTRPLFWDPLQMAEEKQRTAKLAAGHAAERERRAEIGAERARRKADGERRKRLLREQKERVKAQRWREKRRREASGRRGRLHAGVARRLRRLLGQGES